MTWFSNSEGERIGVIAGQLRGQPVEVLVIADDPRPVGSGVHAPMLLDAQTKAWLATVATDQPAARVQVALELLARFERLRLETGWNDDYRCDMTEVRYDCTPGPEGPGGTAGFDPPATSLYNWLAADMRR